jgi:hypothetical protein
MASASVQFISVAVKVQAFLRITSAIFRSKVLLQVRSFPREYHPYQTRDVGQRSYILRVEDSDLARNYIDYRTRHYPQFQIKEKTHYVVLGHDIYHEILATSFATAMKVQITDARLLGLIAAH